MDLIDRMREISNQAPRRLEHINTEEATKTHLSCPSYKRSATTFLTRLK